MKFFAVHISDLESDQFLAASNDQIATWLLLHALCSKQCNGGTIDDAQALPDRFWSRHGITDSILRQPSPLWTWNGENLTITPYDIDGQVLFEKKSKGGKLGMEKRWKGTPDKTLSKTLNRPNITLPNITQQDITQEEPSSSGDEEIDFFNADEIEPSKKTIPLQELAENIYQEYPRKKAKPSGIKAILAAMKKKTPALLLDRTKAYAKAIQWQEKRYIPYPATWFNEEGYNDDPAEWEKPTSKPAPAPDMGGRASLGYSEDI